MVQIPDFGPFALENLQQQKITAAFGVQVGAKQGDLLREAPITFLWPTRSQRPSPSPSVRRPPHRSAKSTKNGPPETDLANSIAGRGVPKKGHFLDLTQIRQLMQSDSIILILYVDDKKKPKMDKLDCSKLRAPRPAGVV